MADNRNMILAIVISAAILFGYEFFFVERAPMPEQAAGQTNAQTGSQTGAPTGVTAPNGSDATLPVPKDAGQMTPESTAPGAIPGTAPTAIHRAAALAQGPRIQISSPRLIGSIALRGARIDDLTLTGYRETLKKDSAEVTTLNPKGAKGAFFAEFGWVGSKGSATVLPGPDTLWQANRKTLTPETPVTLRWDNGQGFTFIRTIGIDKDYLFTVTDRIENHTTASADFYPYGLIARHDTPETTGFYILHEGLLGVIDDTLKEVNYDDLAEEGQIEQPTTGGWIGITDKYWLTALILDQKEKVNTRFVYQGAKGQDKYQTDFLGEKVSVAPGGAAEETTHLFSGAKEIKIIDIYEESLGVSRFDLAIDFGWFYFLTKPIFYLLIYINDYVGNFGIAILLLTVLIKLVFFPLANKSYVSMSKMKKLQPEMVTLKERFGDDKVRLNQEVMALYKREKANPAAGCLPILVQIPVFFALYKVLFVTIEMRHAPFFGWIHDLSAKDPTSLWNLFGLIPWEPALYLPDAINIGVWPIIMGLTMFLQQKLNPQPADPVQAKIFMFLPFIFTFLLAPFPAGLVIYWAWNNSLSIAQQWVIMRRMGVKV